MKKNKQIQPLTVSNIYALTPHMQRIEFSCDNAELFPKSSAGQYIKLLFTPQGSTDLALLNDQEQPTLRTYTIQSVDSVTNKIIVDFVKHQSLQPTAVLSPTSGGYAQHFAQHAAIGDTIAMLGPNSTNSPSFSADWVLLVADLSSLAALNAQLSALPSHTKGHLVIELLSDADKSALPSLNEKEITLTLCIKGKTPSLAHTVQSLKPLPGTPSIWCACEFNDMKAIRRYLTDRYSLLREECYFSSYWKEGTTEDGHKIAKRADQEEFAR